MMTYNVTAQSINDDGAASGWTTELGSYATEAEARAAKHPTASDSPHEIVLSRVETDDDGTVTSAETIATLATYPAPARDWQPLDGEITARDLCAERDRAMAAGLPVETLRARIDSGACVEVLFVDGRAGIAAGADAQWTDAHDAADGLARWLGDGSRWVP